MIKLFMIMMTCTLSHAYLTHYSLKVQRKRGIISAILLTVAGVTYSTFQTLYIMKSTKEEILELKP